MANNTSLFGTPTTTGQVASKNFTTLYSGPVNTIPVEVIGNTTYDLASSPVAGGANLNLVGSDGSADSIKFLSGTNITVSSIDANTIQIATNQDINTTYTQNASATTGGANLNLVGSDATTDAVKFASAGSVTVSRTDANTITINGTGIAPGSIGLDDLNDVTFGTLAKGQFILQRHNLGQRQQHYF
jgi:hypothetical protein